MDYKVLVIILSVFLVIFVVALLISLVYLTKKTKEYKKQISTKEESLLLQQKRIEEAEKSIQMLKDEINSLKKN